MPLTPTDRARRYLSAIPGAIQGQRGSDHTFSTAVALIHGFNLDDGTAFDLLWLDWNPKCQPPWSEGELRHKVRDAVRTNCSKPHGWLLKDGDDWTPPAPRAITPIVTMPQAPLEWPIMRLGTRAELSTLAHLRGLGLEGVTRAQEAGLLRFGTWKQADAWFVTDPGAPFQIAQARRMDGEDWGQLSAKSWTICRPGLRHACWPVGASLIGDKPTVALVEGGPDLLAAYHFAAVEGMESTCQPVCLLGAGMTIHPDALPLFTGKHVRIFPDNDTAGQSAAAGWIEQLEAVGASWDWFDYIGYTTADGQQVKDLNDLAHMGADTFEEHFSELMGIMPRGVNRD
jgi:hypothetical protein